MYQDLSTRHDWPVKKAIVDLPVRLKENSKRIFWSFFESVRGPRTKISAPVRKRYAPINVKPAGGEAGHGVGI